MISIIFVHIRPVFIPTPNLGFLLDFENNNRAVGSGNCGGQLATAGCMLRAGGQLHAAGTYHPQQPPVRAGISKDGSEARSETRIPRRFRKQ